MKLLKTKKIVKEIKQFQLHESFPIKIEAIYENSKLKDARFIGEGPHNTSVVVVKPEFFDLIKKFNPWWQIHHKFGWDGMTISAKEIISQNLEIQPENIIYYYESGHLIFDLNKELIPIPFGYDYISSPFSNKVSDLKPLLEHLKTQNWVINKDELYIESVPYYNNEDRSEQYIKGKEIPYVCILPDKESLNEAYKRSLEVNKKYFSVTLKELIVSDAHWNWSKTKEKDYLNLRQFYKPKNK